MSTTYKMGEKSYFNSLEWNGAVLTSSCQNNCTLNSFTTHSTFHCQNRHTVQMIKLVLCLTGISVNILLRSPSITDDDDFLFNVEDTT